MTGSVIWKSGWYASRLHAVSSDTVFPDGRLGTVKALCGQYVYADSPTEWARRYVERGVPHCKRCDRIVSQNDCPHTSAAPADSVQGLVQCDRPWSDYPLGTRVYAIHGGYWTRVENGWKWFAGDTFPRPGGEAVGRCVLLPPNAGSEVSE